MLETLFVFVDSEALYAARFDVDGGALRRLAELVSRGRIRIVVPEVAAQEYNKKLEERLEESVSSLQSFQNKAGLLSLAGNSDISRALGPVDIDALRGAVKARFLEYVEQLNPIRIETPPEALAKILDAYFQGRPPFGNPKKKHEFPDAVILCSVEDWCEQEDLRCYVVSRDGDMKATADTSDHLIHIESLDQLFDLITAEDEKVGALLEAADEFLREAIKSRFENAGFHLEDEDGEVYSVAVESVDIDDVRVQDIDEQNILIEVSGTVRFSAEIAYWDMVHAIYDSEDKRLIPFERIQTTVRTRSTFQGYGTIMATDADLLEVDEVDVDLNLGWSVGVDPHEANRDPWD